MVQVPGRIGEPDESAGLGAGDGMSMMTKSLPQTICKREAALIRRAVAGAPKSETQHLPEQRRLYAAAIAPTRDASGGRRTTAVESEERKPDARTHAGQKKLELHTATRRSKPSTPMREKTANCGHGGRDDLCDGEMRFPALISTRQELRRVWPNKQRSSPGSAGEAVKV